VRDDWTRAAVGTQRPQAPEWTGRLTESLARFVGRKVGRVPLVYPLTTVLGDSVISGVRHVTLRANAPAGTTGLVMRVSGAKVLESSIDGRDVDTARYRYRPRDWVMQYWAVPDSGAIVGLSVPAGAHFEFELAARRPGIPEVPGVLIPPRPDYVVPSQTGDVNIVYRTWRFWDRAYTLSLRDFGLTTSSLMRIVLNIVAVLCILLGCIWLLQGINILPGSFMTGQTKWAVYGGILVVVGIAVLMTANRRRTWRESPYRWTEKQEFQDKGTSPPEFSGAAATELRNMIAPLSKSPRDWASKPLRPQEWDA
jgi:hypothetical protein